MQELQLNFKCEEKIIYQDGVDIFFVPCLKTYYPPDHPILSHGKLMLKKAKRDFAAQFIVGDTYAFSLQ